MFSECRGDRPDPGTAGVGKGLRKVWLAEEVGPKTLGAERERAPSQPRPPRWSQEECQGGDSSSEDPGSLALNGGASRSSVGEPTVMVAAIPGAAAVTLHPAPQ